MGQFFYEVLEEMGNRQEQLNTRNVFCAVVAGCGGIGAWAALDLALSGQVYILILIDPDTVDDSNLNRTPFRLADIGSTKVEALQFLIAERRAQRVETYERKTDGNMIEDIAKIMSPDSPEFYEFCNELGIERLSKPIEEWCAIIDCRDDIYDDMYDLPGKYYKVGYDGFSVTIDGNPQDTQVWGQADGYRTTPSFVCPAQLAANLVVDDVLSHKRTMFFNADNEPIYPELPTDDQGRFKGLMTIDTRLLMKNLYLGDKADGE